MVCCICLLENPDIMNVFDDIGLQLKIAEIVQKYFWFKPQPNNESTSQICPMCWYKIEDFHSFYLTVENAHKEFQNITEQQNRAHIKEEETPCSSKIKQEYIDETFEDNRMQIKIETESTQFIVNHLEDHVDDDEQSENKFAATSDEYEPSYMSEAESNNEQELSNDIKIENTDTEGTMVVKKPTKRKPSVSENEPHSSKKKRNYNRVDPAHIEEIIKKHIPLSCNLCIFVGQTFADIMKHLTISHPSVEPHIMCCEKKFTKRLSVVQHALAHEDPNRFRKCFKMKHKKKIIDHDALLAALKKVKIENQSQHSVAISYGIPYSSLKRYTKRFNEKIPDIFQASDDELQRAVFSISSQGNPAVFTSEEEAALVEYANKCCLLYQKLTVFEFRKLAYQFAKKIVVQYPKSWETKQIVGKSCADILRRKEKAKARKRRFLDKMTDEQREIKKAKDREYHRKCKEAKKLKNVAELTDEEKRMKREEWKIASKKYREKKRTLISLKTNTSPHSDNDPTRNKEPPKFLEGSSESSKAFAEHIKFEN